MSIDVQSPESEVEREYSRYRALSTSAVASVIIGLLSVLAMFDWSLAAVPAIGVALSLFAWRKVARHQDELTGLGLAKVGLVLSAVFLVSGPAWLTYAYLHEVPEGYERISYAELQPDPAVAAQAVPPSALELEGKSVFIKGFVYPGQERFGIRQFLLVRDQGDCCFGGNPKITDRIQVTLVHPLKLNYETRMFKVAGKFHIEPVQTAAGGAKGGVFYHLKADHLE